MNSTFEINIGEYLKLSIKGAPNEQISPEMQIEALLALIKHGLTSDHDLSAGQIAAIQNAILHIGEQEFILDFQLISTHSITRTEIYQIAVRWIELLLSTSKIEILAALEGLLYLYKAIIGEFLELVNREPVVDTNHQNLLYVEPDILATLSEEIRKTGTEVQELANEILRRGVQLKLPLLIQRQRNIERSARNRGHFLSRWALSQDNDDGSDLWKSACLKCVRYVEVNNEGEIVSNDLEFLCQRNKNIR